MAKQEVALAADINKEEIEHTIERVNGNAIYINVLIDKYVKDYCKDLDLLIENVRDILSDEYLINDDELERLILKLPLCLYDTSTTAELLGVKEDITKAIEREIYNNEITNLYESNLTIPEKESRASLKSQQQYILSCVIHRASAIIKNKLSNALEMLSAAKKIMSKHIEESSKGID